MNRKSIPLLAQHESWVSLDPVQGCPAHCAYCYLGASGLSRQAPDISSDTPEYIYQKLSDYQYLEKSIGGGEPTDNRFPIAIGNYTDICMTVKNRHYLLSLLHEHKRRMPMVPVCVVTKARLDEAFLEAINKIGITVIFFISLSFLPMEFEKGAPHTETRLENFRLISQFTHLHAVHFWRPVTSINVPNQIIALRQIELLKRAGSGVSVITGLKFGDNLAEVFSTNEQHVFHTLFKEQAEHSLQNEIFEPEIQEMLLQVAREHSYSMFLHTSCAISSILKQPDYNATFRKPHLETKCLASVCTFSQRERCFSAKANLVSPPQKLLEQVAQYICLPAASVSYSQEKDCILVDAVLTQEQQTFLTQVTSFPVRGRALVPTLEWVGSINR